jgi:hypothetical protein
LFLRRICIALDEFVTSERGAGSRGPDRKPADRAAVASAKSVLIEELHPGGWHTGGLPFRGPAALMDGLGRQHY